MQHRILPHARAARCPPRILGRSGASHCTAYKEAFLGRLPLGSFGHILKLLQLLNINRTTRVEGIMKFQITLKFIHIFRDLARSIKNLLGDNFDNIINPLEVAEVNV
jgi:hypothetical protein